LFFSTILDFCLKTKKGSHLEKQKEEAKEDKEEKRGCERITASFWIFIAPVVTVVLAVALPLEIRRKGSHTQ